MIFLNNLNKIHKYQLKIKIKNHNVNRHDFVVAVG